jgi:hypothetical protein
MTVNFFPSNLGQLRLSSVATCAGHLRMPICSSYEQLMAFVITEETFTSCSVYFQVSFVVICATRKCSPSKDGRFLDVSVIYLVAVAVAASAGAPLRNSRQYSIMIN